MSNENIEVKDIFESKGLKVDLTENGIEVELDNNKKVHVIFEEMSILDALLLRLRYADPTSIPGRSTAEILEELAKKKEQSVKTLKENIENPSSDVK